MKTCFEKLIDNGIIFLHDTYPCDERCTSQIFSGDSWKVPDMIREKYGNVCDIFTVPVQPGLTMVRKHPKVRLNHMRYPEPTEEPIVEKPSVCQKREECASILHNPKCPVFLEAIRKLEQGV